MAGLEKYLLDHTDFTQYAYQLTKRDASKHDVAPDSLASLQLAYRLYISAKFHWAHMGVLACTATVTPRRPDPRVVHCCNPYSGHSAEVKAIYCSTVFTGFP